MIGRVYGYIKSHEMAPPGTRILAAVSGGADSMCLLEILRELHKKADIELRVLHVHHGLRESAEGDLEYVAKYCAAAEIPFEAVRVDAADYAARSRMSVEEAARHLRYEALEEAARKWDEETEKSGRADCGKCRIAVAHHIEDQAETVLFNLVRGSRLTGLRGMLPVNGRIIRPLLLCERGEIEQFLQERGILWREDETNEDVRYSRNLLRREVMPLLSSINAGAKEHIARAAEEAAEAEEYLKKETDTALMRCLAGKAGKDGKDGEAADPGESGGGWTVLKIPALLAEPMILRRRVVYETIAGVSGRKKDLQDIHVQAVLGLAQKQGNGELDVAAGVHVRKVYDRLYLETEAERRKADPAREASAEWPVQAGEYRCRVLDFDGDMESVSRKQYTKWLDYDKIGTFPSFRNRREGDRITLDESGRSKTIARCMIDAKVPRELRDRIVLPVCGNEVLWMPGGRISAAYPVTPDTRRVLEIHWEPVNKSIL